MTPRLRLIHGTRLLAEAELENNARLAALLGVAVPAAWPPESLREALPIFLANCELSGVWGPWTLGWYVIAKTEVEPILCASIGFKGPPTPAGMVEVGYSVLPAFQKQGIATEALTMASRWALDQPGVRVVEAEAASENLASLRVLTKAGFAPCGAGDEPGTRRFRLDVHAAAR